MYRTTFKDVADTIGQWIKCLFFDTRYRLYKKLHSAESTCDRFGHDLIGNGWGSMPASRAFCRCCHKRFEIHYPAGFLEDGVELHEVKSFKGDGCNHLTNDYILSHWR